MTRFLDRLLEGLGYVYELFLYSLALPLGLGVAIVIGEFGAELSRSLLSKGWFVYYGLAIAIGIWLRSLRNRLLKQKKEGHEEKHLSRANRILKDEEDRQFMVKFIGDVEKGKEKKDEDYIQYKKIEEFLGNPISYQSYKYKKRRE